LSEKARALSNFWDGLKGKSLDLPAGQLKETSLNDGASNGGKGEHPKKGIRRRVYFHSGEDGN